MLSRASQSLSLVQFNVAPPRLICIALLAFFSPTLATVVAAVDVVVVVVVFPLPPRPWARLRPFVEATSSEPVAPHASCAKQARRRAP